MQIILLERIEKLGHIGDVVTVKDGYARNFLLPNKKALRANEANRKVFEAQRADIEKRNAEKQKLEDSKSDIEWGHQIRSYVLDQSRIKDLRTGVEIADTTKVLNGHLDPFIEASLKQGL